MAVPLSLGPIHHLRLTVTDVQRSRAFYTQLLGFQIAMDTPPPPDDPHHDLTTDLLQGGIVMVNGDLLLGLRPVDAERARRPLRPVPLRPGSPELRRGRPGCAGGGGADLRGTRRGAQRDHRPAAVRDRGAAVQGPRRYGAGADCSAVAGRPGSHPPPGQGQRRAASRRCRDDPRSLDAD
jgi:catechol 2,3-dioxygenase-like lactoylglutathione lyase family enzyme